MYNVIRRTFKTLFKSYSKSGLTLYNHLTLYNLYSDRL